MNSVITLLGRVCLALIFIMSGFQKLQTFDVGTGGPVMDVMLPSMDLLIEKIQAQSVFQIEEQHLNLIKDNYKWLLLAAALMETVGGVLFVFDLSLGAYLLLIFTVVVTPIIHNFYDLPESYEQMLEMVNFLKNVTIAGGLLIYLGMKGSSSKMRKALNGPAISAKKEQ
eukprot:TRINITY_DN826_c0_g1_i1.p2 TRINITY_DN826_c0_g1~~TRINITY_DN826_c0_g1_i1.p2  ORF type:complete len:169 (-),score=25.93 TRINITY_DN826_c0_g1_i1:209-715(-)